MANTVELLCRNLVGFSRLHMFLLVPKSCFQILRCLKNVLYTFGVCFTPLEVEESCFLPFWWSEKRVTCPSLGQKNTFRSLGGQTNLGLKQDVASSTHIQKTMAICSAMELDGCLVAGEQPWTPEIPSCLRADALRHLRKTYQISCSFTPECTAHLPSQLQYFPSTRLHVISMLDGRGIGDFVVLAVKATQ